ncbi:hypothetical protein GBA52_017900 [Prunus armeniaca]|nr:hypothetical protein GBA52_017900 [Prunus armeniaca]
MTAAQESSKFCEAFPMKSGDGPKSYAKNSTFQREAVDVAKQLIVKEIAEKLDIDILLSSKSNTFHIADLGCSTGPNTFSAVEGILEAGVLLEEKVDSFNLPMYYMSPQELEAAVEQNGFFSIERLEYLPRVPVDDTVSEQLASHLRAALEGLIEQQFGEEILDELFDRYRKKVEEQLSILEIESGKPTHFLAALKRKAN